MGMPSEGMLKDLGILRVGALSQIEKSESSVLFPESRTLKLLAALRRHGFVTIAEFLGGGDLLKSPRQTNHQNVQAVLAKNGTALRLQLGCRSTHRCF
jgi:hypothetical protein